MMTNTNKVTKVQKFEMLRNWMQEIENANNDATIELSAEQSAEITMLCEFIDREMELLHNKSNKASGKPTKTQAANVELKGTILKVLANYGGEGRTISDLMKENPDVLGDYSNQKLSALMRQLVADGLVKKIVDKKKSYFSAIMPVEASTESLDEDETDSEELETF